MADVFISYAREDRQWVEKLAEQLQAEGFSVWWDWDLLVGKRYRETIDAEEVRMLIEGLELPPMRSNLATPSDTGGGVQQVLKPEGTRGGPNYPEGSPSPA